MQRILSTYRYINQALTPALLAEISRAGISAVEVFCAPSHFSYRDEQKIRELADALGEYRLELHSLHSPTERDLSPGRESGVPISISDTERIRRLDAVDEVKRALDVAERIPFRYLDTTHGPRPPVCRPTQTRCGFHITRNSFCLRESARRHDRSRKYAGRSRRTRLASAIYQLKLICTNFASASTRVTRTWKRRSRSRLTP